MVFSSFEFLFRFLPFFLLIYYVTPQKWKNAVLFAGSILFYTAGEAEYVVLLLASVVINYVFGRLMYRDTYEGRGKKQLILLIVALCYDFGVLFLFKYSGFMDKLPLGISFYTFQIAAYIIDVYRGRVLSLIHISEPTRRTPISYAVFCLKKKKIQKTYCTFD